LNQPVSNESRKRKREILFVFLTAVLFLGLTWFEIRLFGISQQLPFVHSIFFFGLVNFNIVLLLLLLFFIFRNVVKVYVERRGKIFGSSLKAKLVVAFMGFSIIPAVLIFLTLVFYVNASFDKWFSVKMGSILKSSLEVTNAYYFNAKKRNYHFAHQIAEEVSVLRSRAEINRSLKRLRHLYSLDAVEYYPNLMGQRELVLSEDESIPVIPRVSLEFLQKGIQSEVDASTILQFAEGNLVRVVVPLKEGSSAGAVVVSSYVPLSLTSKINDIQLAYEEFRDVNPLEYPLKSIYLIILGLMTLVILLAATWFGFHLAKQLSTPLVLLGRATKRVAGGDYTPVEVKTGSEEIASLVSSFNQMTENLSRSEKDVRSANQSLHKTLDDLDRHTRYIEVVLASVSAGVISVDKQGIVTTINRHAGDLLKIDPKKYLHRPVRELLTSEYFRIFSELIKTMQEHRIESLQKELTLSIQGEALPIQMTLSILKNDFGEEVGKILVFDDMTAIVAAQRSAAWTEVARRIAHEIKNPLTPIKLSAERLQRKFGDQITDPAFRECTAMIISQTDDLKNLVNEFSQFARMPQAKLVPGFFSRVIEESVILYQQSHPQIRIMLDLDRNVPEFKFDPDQMKRVLVNLLDNSINAILSDGQCQDPEIRLALRYEEDLKIVRFSITDNGPGIPADHRARIFEPYFSTKEGGTGLGLAIVKRIVEDHSGFVRAYSHEPRGAKFVIELPVNELGAWKPADPFDKTSVRIN
jgi:two-component system nitrogen regulation sensor histidine kinase NtrY